MSGQQRLFVVYFTRADGYTYSSFVHSTSEAGARRWFRKHCSRDADILKVVDRGDWREGEDHE